MWTRIELKERGKKNFKRVYISAVIVCIIFSILTSILNSGQNAASNHSNNYQLEYEYLSDDAFENNTINSIYNLSIDDSMVSAFNNLFSIIENTFSVISSTTLMLVFLGITLLILCLKVIILYPIEIGKNNFFMGIRESDRKIGDILYVFKKGNLFNSIFIMFFRTLFIFLWSLLLFIPGIIKSYEYRMIPYILAENSNIDKSRAFELSKYMMSNQKFDTFVLDLSFIGWNILSGFTFGILSYLYVNPYVEATNAELYAVLRNNAVESGFASCDELPGFF